MKDLSIGDVARAAGIAASAIRYYESIGLLPAPARVHGRRRYDDSAVSWLAVIGLGKALGFTLAEIRVLVDGIAKGDRSPRRLQALARAKLPEIEATLRRAHVMRRFLRAAQHCRCLTLDECAAAARRALPPFLSNVQPPRRASLGGRSPLQ